ncbi:ribbon-helix-helix protein, CopG family [Calothrix rhizosoleniae]|uniref:ribbon-helix-helix protein, CopG family n=1 Tax=Calothrix rhizosoleniae TaxID=888997 RepID=UPI000B4A5417|nr:ribbon-helix-helix protein, CopG family [Calothrix rhizosoleniae]
MKKRHGRYEEPKERVNISLTSTAIENLDLKASQMGVSRSELIELIARESEELPPGQKVILGK